MCSHIRCPDKQYEEHARTYATSFILARFLEENQISLKSHYTPELLPHRWGHSLSLQQSTLKWVSVILTYITLCAIKVFRFKRNSVRNSTLSFLLCDYEVRNQKLMGMGGMHGNCRLPLCLRSPRSFALSCCAVQTFFALCPDVSAWHTVLHCMLLSTKNLSDTSNCWEASIKTETSETPKHFHNEYRLHKQVTSLNSIVKIVQRENGLFHFCTALDI